MAAEDPNTPDKKVPLDLVTTIVSAFLENNAVALKQLPGIISSVHDALKNVGIEITAKPAEGAPTPAVPIRKSVFPDFIVCLEDGKKLKMLKRHLDTHYGLSPEAYRTKWKLPRDYPMVAPNYAEQRSALAKKIGLGRRPEPVPEPAVAKPARRARASARQSGS